MCLGVDVGSQREKAAAKGTETVQTTMIEE